MGGRIEYRTASSPAVARRPPVVRGRSVLHVVAVPDARDVVQPASAARAGQRHRHIRQGPDTPQSVTSSFTFQFASFIFQDQ